jgi:hypothetical protein
MASHLKYLMAAVVLLGASSTRAEAWNFVSSPDWFNRDVADLSGATSGVPEADGWDAHQSAGGG